MVDLVQKSSFYQALWHVFKNSCLVMAYENKWQHYSGKMELCLDRKLDVSLVHFHLAITDDVTVVLVL